MNNIIRIRTLLSIILFSSFKFRFLPEKIFELAIISIKSVGKVREDVTSATAGGNEKQYFKKIQVIQDMLYIVH
jgi:hypothetical protein